MTTTSDSLHRFIFENTDIRGEMVTLDKSFQEILSLHQYPETINHLLGEFLAAITLLSSTLKFDGTVTLQARGNGDLSLIVAEINHQKKIRGLAQFNQEKSLANRTLKDLLGDGVLSIIIDPDKGERYQGIVALEGEHLSDCIEGYFMQSEQLPTKLWLNSTSNIAAGILLQRLPQQVASEETNNDVWETQVHLASTVSNEELITLSHEELLTRLFHESDVRVFPPESIVFSCSCSKERSSQTLKRLGRDELQTIINEDGKISVDCHFCGHQYIYKQDDINRLFASPTQH